MLVLNNTPFVHARVYLQYLNNDLPGPKWGQYVVNLGWVDLNIKNICATIIYMPIQVELTWIVILNGQF